MPSLCQHLKVFPFSSAFLPPSKTFITQLPRFSSTAPPRGGTDPNFLPHGIRSPLSNTSQTDSTTPSFYCSPPSPNRTGSQRMPIRFFSLLFQESTNTPSLLSSPYLLHAQQVQIALAPSQSFRFAGDHFLFLTEVLPPFSP